MEYATPTMKARMRLILLGFLLCGTLPPNLAAGTGADHFLAARALSGADLSSGFPALQEKLAGLRKEVCNLPGGVRRGRFQ